MEDKVLKIINIIRSSNNLNTFDSIHPSNNLRNDIEFTSLDLAELTVRIEDEFGVDIFEDGLVNTIGEIYQKLQ
jgi:acyl carrier protein